MKLSISPASQIEEQKRKSPLIDRPGAAEYLGVKTQTLASWAANGRYELSFVRIGRRVLYRIADLDAFIAGNLITGGAA